MIGGFVHWFFLHPFSSKVRHNLDDEELDVSHRRGPVVATPMAGGSGFVANAWLNFFF